jgi:uncharacterized protein (DUF169 family)
MSDFSSLSDRLTSALALMTEPVALTFSDHPAANAARPEKTVPAGCSFWEVGATQSIVTNASDHAHCSIGIHTHNLTDAPASQRTELQNALAAMQGLDYVRPDEVQGLPVVAKSHPYVTYTPLRDLTQTPDVVLLFAHASQGLVLSEALARVDGSAPPALGRPACALVPQVMNSSSAAVSLGCCGARAYIDGMTDAIALWGLVGAKLEAYTGEIETLAKANAVLTQFHAQRRQDIEAGATPTVEQSLAKLG